ncbi:hypothetical protein OIO90_003948 [Microbotryomycetes sp. JL221]|nr:hypothetical protein OIO90_003948 [Microbotryomycetes sp. JL221]
MAPDNEVDVSSLKTFALDDEADAHHAALEKQLSAVGSTADELTRSASTSTTLTAVPVHQVSSAIPSATRHSRPSDEQSAPRGADEDVPSSTNREFTSFPDGGWFAWLQVACCFVLFFSNIGQVYSFGVFQDALEERGVAPSSTLAFIGSTQAVLQALMAIPNRKAIEAYGPRRCAIVGSLLAGLGPILAGSATHSVPGLVVTAGIMFGAGQSICFSCSATLPSMYFLKRRNMATGIVYAGAGFGGAAISLFASFLITKLDIAWAFRIIGIVFLSVSLPCSLMLKSRTPRVPIVWKRQRDKKTADDDDNDTAQNKIVDFSLFKDVRFSLFFAAGAIVVFPLFVPPFFLPLFARSVIGLTPGASAALLAGFNIASAVGRIVFGIGADMYLGAVNAMLACLMGFAISTLLIWPFATSVAPLALFAILSGAAVGGFFSLIPGFLATLFGTKTLSVAFPMIITSFVPGYFGGFPLAAALVEAFGGPSSGVEAFKPAIFYSGGLSLISAILVGGVRWKEGGSWRRKI